MQFITSIEKLGTKAWVCDLVTAFLGVEKSLTGRRWEERQGDGRAALALAQQLGVSEILGRFLAGRGITQESAEDFLNPTLRSLMPDPSSLADMDRAAARLAQAIGAGEAIAVFGDYDVDGATSAALLRRFLTGLGQPLRIYVPDRVKEGYGPNGPALLRLRDEGASLAITVDCGISAFEPLQTAADAGLDVIVLDHHLAEARLPTAHAVVNPNRLDDTTPLGHLAAVGVTFLFLVAVNRCLRDDGWYAKSGKLEPDLKGLLDLVALGTVCDVVPLKGLNRAFVAQGLKVMGQRLNRGLVALSEVARLAERPGSYHLGFLLGPRINAGGRVGESDLGARLLSSDDEAEVSAIARHLDSLNDERRAIEAVVLDQAITQVEEAAQPGSLTFAVGEGWHPGVIGIVASRLKERYNKPSIVVALDGEIGKGSGRSVGGVDLGAAVVAARQAGLLVNGGGHAMAAGLTVVRDQLEALRQFFQARIAAMIEESGFRATLTLDGALRAGAAKIELVRELDACEPFGMGNSAPRFALPAVRIMAPSVVGESHVRMRLEGPGGERVKAIAFRALDSGLGPGLLQAGSLPLHVAGRLKEDNWAGPDAVQFIVEDAARLTR